LVPAAQLVSAQADKEIMEAGVVVGYLLMLDLEVAGVVRVVAEHVAIPMGLHMRAMEVLEKYGLTQVAIMQAVVGEAMPATFLLLLTLPLVEVSVVAAKVHTSILPAVPVVRGPVVVAVVVVLMHVLVRVLEDPVVVV
jgi:hypothetical protein